MREPLSSEPRGQVKPGVIIVIGTLVVLLLAGGAYISTWLFTRVGQLGDTLANPGQVVVRSDGSGGAVTTGSRIAVERTQELPDRTPELAGVYARRTDNRIFVTDTSSGVTFLVDEDGTVSTSSSGPDIEVVITSDTAVYVDLTSEQLNESALPDTIKQRLKRGTLEEIGQASVITAWGTVRGDRIVAECLVYTRPPVIHR